MFKRRFKRSFLNQLREFLWPQGGWARAFQYVKHRLRRLPDTPQRISRGVAVGVFMTFTPFYGLHFLFSALCAKMLNANILAALLGTFFGNPLTYFPIGLVSLNTGYFLLGLEGERDPRSFGGKFIDAGQDLFQNLGALVTDKDADWKNLIIFYHEAFFPYMIGGIAPGLLAGLLVYYLSLPVVTAYQKRRKGFLKEKILSLKKKKSKSS